MKEKYISPETEIVFLAMESFMSNESINPPGPDVPWGASTYESDSE